MSDKEIIAAATLLHDIKTFWQRSGSTVPLNAELAKSNSNNSNQDLLAIWHGELTEPLAKIVADAHQLVTGLYDGHLAKNSAKDRALNNYLPAITTSIAIDPKDKIKNSNWYYKLKALALNKDIFPEELKDGIKDDDWGTYQELWQAFIGEHQLLPQGSIRAYLDSLTYLLHKYTWAIPVEVSAKYADISFYDHSRISAAIAVCLYHLQQHLQQANKEHAADQKVTSDQEEFLFIEGDISGIQKFIYNPTFNGQELYDGMARRLRGRSFYLNLLLKTITDFINEKLDLCGVNIIWATGGHFLIIAPNTEAVGEALRDAQKTVEKWLWQEFRGALGIIIATETSTADQLKNFSQTLKQLSQKLKSSKLQQWQAALHFKLTDEVDTIWQDGFTLNMQRGVCKDTGNDMSEAELTISDKCQFDKDQPDAEIPARSPQSIHFDHIGRMLLNARTMQLVRKADWQHNGKGKVFYRPTSPNNAEPFNNNVDHLVIKFPAFERCWVLSTSQEPLPHSDLCLSIANKDNEQINFLLSSKEQNIARGFELMVTSAKVDDNGDLVGFNELAEAAKGTNFLGVLRMDVDDLGFIFSSGLLEDERSISKIANLSRTIELFFAGYLNKLVSNSKYENLYTTYAGGDDLFIIGAWNEVLALSAEIRSAFKNYCADNRDLHISAGISLCKGKYPIGRAAIDAEKLLNEIAKSAPRNIEGDTDKDALAFLEQKISWQMWHEVHALAEEIRVALENKKLARRFIYNLLALYRQHIDPQRDLKLKHSKEDLRWLAKFKYSLVRNVSDKNLTVKLLEKIPAYKDYLPILAGYVSLITRSNQKDKPENTTTLN